MALKGILRFCTSVRLSKELTRSWPQNSGRGSVRPLKKHVYITRVGAILEKEHRGLGFMVRCLGFRVGAILEKEHRGLGFMVYGLRFTVGAILEKEHRGLWFMIYGLWIRPSWRKHLADIIWSESYNVLLTCC